MSITQYTLSLMIVVSVRGSHKMYVHFSFLLFSVESATIIMHLSNKLFANVVFIIYQLLEVVRLEGHSLAQEDAFLSRDIHLLQVLF